MAHDDMTLRADELRSDPRVSQAAELLRDALEAHRSWLDGVRPPREELQAGYEQMLKEFSRQRGGDLFYPYLGSGLGNGPLVELADGSVKYDMITGIGVHAFGHSHPDLMAAALQAALSDTVMQGNLQQNRESLLVTENFIELACQTGGGLRHCFLTTSGATANENALKLLFQRRSPAGRMLAFANGFAGRTLATSQLTDRSKNRAGLPTVLPVDFVPFFDQRHPEASLDATLARLQEHCDRYPSGHAGMVMELIQGEGGYYCAPREFLLEICRWLKQRQIPVWFDEIQTFGRTSRPFAFQHYELDEYADVVTVGKLTQVCATLFSDEFVPRPGLISQTFTGATAAIVAARTILQRLHEGDLYGTQGRLMQIHSRFAAHFERWRAEDSRLISGPWGLGGMVAFTPLDGTEGTVRKVLDQLFAAGVIAFSAGSTPARIRMLPPFAVIRDNDIDAVCAIIEATLKSNLQSVTGDAGSDAG